MPDPRPTLAAPDDDPHLWLEAIDTPDALSWVAAQNARTLSRLTTPALQADAEALRTVLDRPDNIPHVTRRGGLLYNFWRDAQNPRGLWRRTALAAYRTGTPAWDTLLDLDALAAAESEDWVWAGAATLPPAHARAILRLSRGGGDAVTLREFDLSTRQFPPGGFTLPEAKGGADWLDADTLLLTTAGCGATDSGYARTVRLWPRGTDPLAAPTLFEVPPGHMGAWGSYDRDRGQLVFTGQIGFYDSETWLGDRTGPRQRLDLPTDVAPSWNRGWLALRPRTPWVAGSPTSAPITYAADTILGIALDAFLAGSRAFTVLFTPEPRRAFRNLFWTGDTLVIAILDNLRPIHLLATPGATPGAGAAPGHPWSVRPLEGLPAIGTVNVWPLDTEDAESDGSLLALAQTPITPPALTLLHPGTAPAILRQAPAAFDPGAATVTQHEAIAPDGERIPYIQVGPPTGTGNAPVYMTGYGGFGIPMLPTYGPRTGKLWLERGGTTVTACLRGGGEFGTAWHDAGRLANKPRSHDDFAAVAQDLVRRGVTTPGRIAAEGGSNGGLLIANMLTRYPECFGALFCTIPLIDMRRFHRLLAGASWIAEYGNPDNPADWSFIQAFSAYHAATPGRPYPPTLIATTRRDDRVHPGHARKMAAKLQTLGYDTLFYEPGTGGHGYGKDNAETAHFAALGMAFLRRAIGWT